METNAIEIINLCIKYKRLKKCTITKNFFRLGEKKPAAFEVLKRISFTVKKGSILGIVGKNGSGKSTLLNAVAGIFSPDEGHIDVKGNSVSLMSIGVGFQKALTGRENILLSGMLLGFSKKEIRQRENEIIAFSELGEFIDMPLKTYSSGMYSKLAFSITATLKTDIMLIDEVLSVGDTSFKKKSYNKMRELILDENKTVLIVSHAVETLHQLCDEILWLHEGEVKMKGSASEVLDAYSKFMEG